MSALLFVLNTPAYGALRQHSIKSYVKTLSFFPLYPSSPVTTTWLITSASKQHWLTATFETPLTESHALARCNAWCMFYLWSLFHHLDVLTAFLRCDILCRSKDLTTVLPSFIWVEGCYFLCKLGCTPPAVGGMQRGEDCSVNQCYVNTVSKVKWGLGFKPKQTPSS
jgi:hypothetical protein